MSRKYYVIVMSLLVSLFLLPEFSIKRVEARSRKKTGYFTRLTRKLNSSMKRSAKKIRRASVKAMCGIQNQIMDASLKAGSSITGKKPKKTFVKGHYKKGNKKHTKGHIRSTRRRRKKTAAPPAASGGSYASPVDTYGGGSDLTLPPPSSPDGGMSFSRTSAKKSGKKTRKSSSRKSRKK